jgi:PAP2 superfamily
MRALIALRPHSDDRPIIAAALLCYAAIAATLLWHGVNPFRPGSYFSNLLVYASCFGLFIAYRVLKLLYLDRPEHPTKHIIDHEFSAVRVRYYARALPVVACLIIFMPVFSALKSSIPIITDYQWDAYFIDLDRQLHGTDPWKLLQPLLGYPLVTSLVSMFYHAWIMLIYAGGLYFGLRFIDVDLRKRYFISYFLIWTIVGGLLAVLMASVGPCFAEPMIGLTDFRPQMAYLREADQSFPVLVLQVQDKLIAWQQSGAHGLGRGISAMPSMHVSLALLFFLACSKISKRAASLAGAFFLIILLGSVHLGYHYAVDGYLAIVVTLAIWHLVGAFQRLSQPGTAKLQIAV